ncbi:hypothetical protein GJ496_001211 [Pomphorhynchus laevis]|nr:hypothetical protein GJ496_001211 [Pomphorhynchus laevis]
MQTIAKCRASRSHLDCSECISQLRQDVSIQIAKCASMARTCRTDGASYEKLTDSLYRTLLPSILGQTTINDITRQLITLPLRHGGLGISDPSEKPENEYIRSMRMCEPLLAGISGNELRHQQYSLASLIRAEKDQFAHGKLANLTINKLEISEVVRQAKCYTMTKIAFHDAVAARYNWIPPNCP